jgi:hypothetical protein
LNVGRIELPWRNADNTTTGTAYYPATTDALGESKKVKQYYCADADAAYLKAKKLYWKERCPYGVLVEANGAPRTTTSGEVCRITISADSRNVVLNRPFMIQQAQHRFENQALSSVFSLLQIGREDERA